MGDPDVTLGWGSGGVRDGEGDVVEAELRGVGVGEIVMGEVGVVSCGGGGGVSDVREAALGWWRGEEG